MTESLFFAVSSQQKEEIVKLFTENQEVLGGSEGA